MRTGTGVWSNASEQVGPTMARTTLVVHNTLLTIRSLCV
jgi:hypothetical protein